MMPARHQNLPASTSSIDEMDDLLAQLRDFEKQIKQPGKLDNPSFRQEYALFKRYLQWRIEDFNKAMRDELNSHINSMR
jgi:hypothetical protein